LDEFFEKFLLEIEDPIEEEVDAEFLQQIQRYSCDLKKDFNEDIDAFFGRLGLIAATMVQLGKYMEKIEERI
jgi:hypothetical protein